MCIRDSPLPGANIIAVHQSSGSQYGTSTRLDGKYNINGMRVGGPYTITVSFVGYNNQAIEGVYPVSYTHLTLPTSDLV